METNKNIPYAFPLLDEAENKIQNGMTLRDYFANSAMQGICVNAGRNGVNFSEVEKIAEMSYLLADAMLKQRELWMQH